MTIIFRIVYLGYYHCRFGADDSYEHITVEFENIETDSVIQVEKTQTHLTFYLFITSWLVLIVLKNQKNTIKTRLLNNFSSFHRMNLRNETNNGVRNFYIRDTITKLQK